MFSFKYEFNQLFVRILLTCMGHPTLQKNVALYTRYEAEIWTSNSPLQSRQQNTQLLCSRD